MASNYAEFTVMKYEWRHNHDDVTIVMVPPETDWYQAGVCMDGGVYPNHVACG